MGHLVDKNIPEQVEKNNDVLYYYAKTENDRNVINSIIKKYPFKITPYLKELFEESDALRKQFLPSLPEIKTSGSPTPFEEGKAASKIYGLERVYRDRVLLTPVFDCPAYCRFCYKKSRVMRQSREMTIDEIDQAVDEVGKMSEVRGALITGGDPLMNVDKLFYMLDKLIELENIHEVRIGTRSILVRPEFITDELCDRISKYNRPCIAFPEKSKSIAINVHFNHPDELTPKVSSAIAKFTDRGILLRNQTVLLKGINDNISTMKRLFELLLRNRVIPYYMNHCMPVESSDHLRTSVAKGASIYRELCTESSTIIPNYVYAPSGGKVHVGPDTKFEYIMKENKRYIKVKMLYTAKEFRQLTKHDLPCNHCETEDGYIEGYYLDGEDNTDEI